LVHVPAQFEPSCKRYPNVSWDALRQVWLVLPEISQVMKNYPGDFETAQPDCPTL
jgi:hypothetical protein